MKSVKWEHFDGIYDAHFPAAPRNIFEIGVRQGGSLVRWRRKFPEAEVVGLDINGPSGVLDGTIVCHQGSQADKPLLKIIAEMEGGFDIVIDDGSHRPYHQVASFTTLWPHVREGGCYIVEDLHMQGKLRWKLWNLLMPNMYRIALKMAKAQDRPITEWETATRAFHIHFYPHCLVFVKQIQVMKSIEKDYQ